MSDVVVVLGPGLIGQAVARRVGTGKHVVLADLREANAAAAADVFGSNLASPPAAAGTRS
jgi:predicted dinucleotide-binding enzyme